ncbi:MAG TPA: Holliday junction resolvase RuvX [Gemmatimonadales bacterium]|jgi:putative Holliday junction resolvase|nr:Holliday junction resolvase RuvX [Gemmatimonadales bacterium]
MTTARQHGRTAGADPLPSSRTAILPLEGRLLGVDWGEKRIGLAISDPTQTVATPLGTLTRRAGKRFPMGQLKPHLETHQPVGVVVGLPLDASGGEGPAARAARDIGALIAAKTGLPVTYWDERMTTARVRRAQQETGRTRGRVPREADPLAATLVLQTFLDRRRS